MSEMPITIEKSRLPRVLLLRSYHKATFSAMLARGLRQCKHVEFMQYPPWPSDRHVKLKKLYHYKEAWDDLHVNIIANFHELHKKLDEKYFDFALIVDDSAQLFHYSQKGILKKLRMRFDFLRQYLRQSKDNAQEHFHYDCSFPLSLAELGQYLPIVGIDISDAACLLPPNRTIFQESALYFKRELPFDRFFLYYPDRPSPWETWRKKLLPMFDKIYGIPLGIEDDKYAQLKTTRIAKQDIDVFFAGEVTNTLRKTALWLLKEYASNASWNIVIKESLPFHEYCELTARSKITISIAGSRWECFRHYEAAALGSLPLINKPTVDAVWWHPMPEEIFFENTFSNFTARIEQLLQHDELRRTCLNALEQQIEQHMLHSKIVTYIVNTSLEKLSLRGQEK